MGQVILDKEMLHNLYGDSPDDIVDMFRAYLNQHDEILSSFKTAFGFGLDSLRRCVHFHSSAFIYIGFPQLAIACSEFERKCIAYKKNSQAIETDFNTLIKKITESAILVKQELYLIETALTGRPVKKCA